MPKYEVPSGEDKVLRTRGGYRGFGYGGSAKELRRVRRMVRYTASLISTEGRIRESPGPMWAADFERRIIFWRVTDPNPPFELLSEDDLLVLTVHEGSHLKFTGRYHTPDGVDAQRFHRFINFLEDIRIERLIGAELPGFVPLSKSMNTRALKAWDEKIDSTMEYEEETVAIKSKVVRELSYVDQVSLLYHCYELGKPRLLDADPKCAEFARITWPIVSRICNVSATAEVADEALPIYKLLQEEEEGGEGEGEPDGERLAMELMQGGMPGQGELSDRPYRSGGDEDMEGDTPCTRGDADASGDVDMRTKLEGMRDDARTAKARSKLEVLINNEERAQSDASDDAALIAGPQAGNHDHTPEEDGDAEAWENTKRDMRMEINSLTRKLQTVLRTNTADDWFTGQRRGQLDMGLASSSLRGNMNVFRTLEEVGAHDYVFGILVDVSSSQSYRRQELLKATVLMAEACDNAQLDTFVLPWSDHPGDMKRVRESLKNHRGRLGSTIDWPRGGTYEAPALVLAGEEFDKVQSSHKMLVCITDGETRNSMESRELISELVDEGVRVIGVAVGESCEELNLEQYSEVDRLNAPDAKELVQLLPLLLTSMMRKGQ